MRGGVSPKWIIEVPGGVDAEWAGCACRLRLQTRGLKVLTDAECMPDLTVQSQGREVSRNEYVFCPNIWEKEEWASGPHGEG